MNVTYEDTTTNSIIRIESTGTPCAGYGVSVPLEALKLPVELRVESSTTCDRLLGEIAFAYEDPVDATRRGYISLSVKDVRAFPKEPERLVEVARINADGQIGLRDENGNWKYVDISKLSGKI